MMPPSDSETTTTDDKESTMPRDTIAFLDTQILAPSRAMPQPDAADSVQDLPARADRQLRPRRIRIPVLRDYVRSFAVEPGVIVHHVYPTLADYRGSVFPGDTNPRSHKDDTITGAIPRDIARTITKTPADFYLANRGITILAQHVEINTTNITVILTEQVGPAALHGIADGGTTDLVIARLQERYARPYHVPYQSLRRDQIRPELQEGRVHLEIIEGLEDRQRIRHLVAGRNTSRQVTSWTLLDFQGGFAWLKDLLEDAESPFKGTVGYEQNAGAAISVMDILAILSLFHPVYNQPDYAPTAAYAARGRLDKRLMNAKLAPGYRQLADVLFDLLRLHDALYLAFPAAYKKAVGGRGKLALRRDSAGARLFPDRPHALSLTRQVAPVTVPAGLLYPMLAAFRGLLAFPPAPQHARWDWEPFQFLARHGAELVRMLLTHMEALHNNPQSVGKAKGVYLALADRVRVLALKPKVQDNGS